MPCLSAQPSLTLGGQPGHASCSSSRSLSPCQGEASRYLLPTIFLNRYVAGLVTTAAPMADTPDASGVQAMSSMAELVHTGCLGKDELLGLVCCDKELFNWDELRDLRPLCLRLAWAVLEHLGPQDSEPAVLPCWACAVLCSLLPCMQA